MRLFSSLVDREGLKDSRILLPLKELQKSLKKCIVVKAFTGMGKTHYCLTQNIPYDFNEDLSDLALYISPRKDAFKDKETIQRNFQMNLDNPYNTDCYILSGYDLEKIKESLSKGRKTFVAVTDQKLWADKELRKLVKLYQKKGRLSLDIDEIAWGGTNEENHEEDLGFGADSDAVYWNDTIISELIEIAIENDVPVRITGYTAAPIESQLQSSGVWYCDSKFTIEPEEFFPYIKPLRIPENFVDENPHPIDVLKPLIIEHYAKRNIIGLGIMSIMKKENVEHTSLVGRTYRKAIRSVPSFIVKIASRNMINPYNCEWFQIWENVKPIVELIRVEKDYIVLAHSEGNFKLSKNGIEKLPDNFNYISSVSETLNPEEGNCIGLLVVSKATMGTDIPNVDGLGSLVIPTAEYEGEAVTPNGVQFHGRATRGYYCGLDDKDMDRISQAGREFLIRNNYHYCVYPSADQKKFWNDVVDRFTSGENGITQTSYLSEFRSVGYDV
ncbi:hypothetical protein CMI47_16230 [Candidatus Pacearchaeota archaeon]|nr:hypothetical protein [Candidatus Pacearchaeota archaeon]|tara:strand:+ start:791 stop:2287 length:1497 start_codon:yes stop_codon:yes gene_type:complete